MLRRWLMDLQPSTSRPKRLILAARQKWFGHPKQCLCDKCWAKVRRVHERDQRG